MYTYYVFEPVWRAGNNALHVSLWNAEQLDATFRDTSVSFPVDCQKS